MLLKSLHAQLTGSEAAVLTQMQAIHGLGGIGKTQTAVEYTYRYQHKYQAVLWVRAAARDTLISDYAIIADLLQLTEQDKQDQTRMVEAVKQWFTRQQDWLLILDNADDLEIVPDFLPTSQKGHLLLTTRDPAVEGMAQSIEVEQMDVREGIELLLQRSRVLAAEAPLEQASQEDRTTAELIVKEMAGLPLAIDQAGAYIEQTRCGLIRYLDLYQQHRADLFKWKRRIRSDYPRTVASTWELAFKQVEQRNPAAADLLRHCAFLDPDSIPEDLFTAGASELGTVLRAVLEDPFTFNEALDLLRSFSLIRRLADTQSFSIHRLVQIVLKDRMDPSTQQQWAEQTVRLVDAAFPEVEFKTWERCKRYLDQVFACLGLMDQHGIHTIEAASLLYQGGWYLNENALHREDELLYQRALTIREQELGSQHSHVGSTLNNLAQLCYTQGRYEEAEPLYRRALTIKEQKLGSEHPFTATTLNNLAQLYYKQGRYEEAEPLYQQALTIRQHMLQAKHPELISP